MKQVISTLRCIFLGFFRDSRAIVTFLISVVLCFLLSSRVTELIARYGIQPFYRRSFLKMQGYWHD